MKTLLKENTERFHLFLSETKQVCIFIHVNPDGDAVGSALAFQEVLENHDVDSRIFVPGKLPDSLSWLNGAGEIDDSGDVGELKNYLDQSGYMACIDFNEPDRVEQFADVIRQSKKPKIIFDHHPKSEGLNGLLFINQEVSSTAEILYFTLKNSNVVPQTDSFAEAIYTGIVTDTGSFGYNSSRPETFQVISDLLGIGFDKDKVTTNVFQQFTESRLRLLGHLLVNRMMIIPECSTAYTYLTLNDLEKYNYQPGDTEGFVNYPLSVKGVKFTALFIEHEEYVKISFRSKGNLAANKFSGRFFNGGGHLNAAGGRSFKTIHETLKEFENLVKKYIHEF